MPIFTDMEWLRTPRGIVQIIILVAGIAVLVYWGISFFEGWDTLTWSLTICIGGGC